MAAAHQPFAPLEGSCMHGCSTPTFCTIGGQLHAWLQHIAPLNHLFAALEHSSYNEGI